MMQNIYDYINKPHQAVRDGYQPCYLTRVSAVICRVTGRGFKIPRSYLIFGLDESLSKNLHSLITLLVWLFLTITLPVSCWVIALALPKGGE